MGPSWRHAWFDLTPRLRNTASDVAGERGERRLDSSLPTPVGSARGSPLGRESFGQGGTDDSAMEATPVARSGSGYGPWFGGRLACHRLGRVHADRRASLRVGGTGL